MDVGSGLLLVWEWEDASERAGIFTSAMDLMFLLSAAIFTLLAIVVATSLLSDSASSARCAKVQPHAEHRNGPGSGLEPKQNGFAPGQKAKKKAEYDWCDISGSAHDHWEVVKSVQSVSPASTTALHSNTRLTIKTTLKQKKPVWKIE